jgi:hypothetical protein
VVGACALDGLVVPVGVIAAAGVVGTAAIDGRAPLPAASAYLQVFVRPTTEKLSALVVPGRENVRAAVRPTAEKLSAFVI